MMTANSLLPVISIPTIINNIKDTLTDNIYTNRCYPDLVSCNIIGISDHLPSFYIIPKKNAVKLPKNQNLYTRNMDFILDLIAVDKIASDNNVICAISNILESTNNVIDTNQEYKRKY